MEQKDEGSNGNGFGTPMMMGNGAGMEVQNLEQQNVDVVDKLAPEISDMKRKQATTGLDRKVSEDRSTIGGVVGISLNSTPADSPEECIESMESSEHESTNGEGTPLRRKPAQQREDSKAQANFSYTQKRTCYKVSNRYRLSYCRECYYYNQSGQKTKNIICRFAAFRKLLSKKQKSGKQKYVTACGFCDPTEDPTDDDIKPWLASANNAPDGLDMELSLQLISHLGDQLCALLQQEREMLEIKKELGKNGNNYWKRMVDHVREMCDVCATTVFNYHWTCDNCGFMVCPECFKARKSAHEKETDENVPKKMRDHYNWLWCTSIKSESNMHKPELLSLTQIIPQKAIDEILKNLHGIRRKYSIDQNCGCAELEKLKSVDTNSVQDLQMVNNFGSSHSAQSNESCPPLKKRKTSDAQEGDLESGSKMETEVLNGIDESEHSSLPISSVKPSDDDSESSDEEGADILGALLAPTGKSKVNNTTSLSESVGNAGKSSSQNGCESQIEVQQQKHFIRTSNNSYYSKSATVEKTCSLAESIKMFPNLKHAWLCSGRLLNLQEPDNEDNYKLFKDLWVRGQPVIVSNVGKKLNRDLWTPEAFNKDCGDKKNDLVNCMTGKTVPSQLLSSFWEGFEDVSKRLKDNDGVPMLLKLKDWPAGEDFATFLPDRFKDLMSALPLKEFTHRAGRLNLAARLPENFIKPDLGPKMYIAYGDGNHLEKGTTNLHLDISDAVNVMVHVGVPKNCDVESHNKAVMDAIETSDCDALTIKRVRQGEVLPGALWHIYRPWDADKIRDLINKRSVERGHAIEPNHDPIHDQVVYLDKDLRRRLCEEYNVNGFPIVQCEGDAVFIPAGAPHQVRNLHNCIKIAEDFVSPENVSHCFQLTEEFRNLSETHSNHEDKLQIKNIVYHAVKDALSVVLQNSSKRDEK